MSVVIIGGNERMEQQYKEICKKYSCKAKVFTRMSGNLKTQIGRPDLIILFTSTVLTSFMYIIILAQPSVLVNRYCKVFLVISAAFIPAPFPCLACMVCMILPWASYHANRVPA